MDEKIFNLKVSYEENIKKAVNSDIDKVFRTNSFGVGPSHVALVAFKVNISKLVIDTMRERLDTLSKNIEEDSECLSQQFAMDFTYKGVKNEHSLPSRIA